MMATVAQSSLLFRWAGVWVKNTSLGFLLNIVSSLLFFEGPGPLIILIFLLLHLKQIRYHFSLHYFLPQRQAAYHFDWWESFKKNGLNMGGSDTGHGSVKHWISDKLILKLPEFQSFKRAHRATTTTTTCLSHLAAPGSFSRRHQRKFVDQIMSQ